MKKTIKITAVFLSLVCTALLALTAAAYYTLPNEYILPQGDTLVIDKIYSAKCKSDGKEAMNSPRAAQSRDYEESLKLFNIIPIKEAKITKTERPYVYAGGNIFGIRLYTSGVIIVGVQGVPNSLGTVSPGERAGLKTGDVITEIDGKKVNTNKEVMEIFENAVGEMQISFVRNGRSKKTTLRPELSAQDGKYKAGLWVRDSTAGIGTMTYYDEKNNIFAGLGHGICDVDTGELMPLLGGDIVEATVNSVTKGAAGNPGELCGSFSGSVIGNLLLNTSGGIYGTALRTPAHSGEKIPVAAKQEVKSGEAYILCTIDGKKAEKFSVEIKKLRTPGDSYKNMVVTVTDERLIGAAGGIVQGMSGSPIIQDGMLVGAVTHVFVGDPLRGYAIYAENMAKLSDSLKAAQNKAS